MRAFVLAGRANVRVSLIVFLPLYQKDNFYRGVAQLVARLLWEQDVGSSNLSTPTTEARESLELVSYATAHIKRNRFRKYLVRHFRPSAGQAALQKAL